MSRSYPEPNPRKLRGIESEIEKPLFTDAQQRLNNSVLYLNPFSVEPDIDEFTCPVFQENNPLGWFTTETCEGKAMGLGCEDLKTCKPYLEQKRLQIAHPELDWEDINNNPEDKLSVIGLIKKGAIINP